MHNVLDVSERRIKIVVLKKICFNPTASSQPCGLFFLSCFTATRKKLFEIAKSFSEKTRRRKTKKRALLKHQSYPPATPSITFAPSVFLLTLHLVSVITDFLSYLITNISLEKVLGKDRNDRRRK